MKLKTIILFVGLFLFFFPVVAMCEEPLPGYSEWSPLPSGDKNEESAIQYGRKVPTKWSEWSETIPSSHDQKSMESGTRRYAFKSAENQVYFDSAKARTLYTWKFRESYHAVFFFADVDTYRWQDESKYQAPPLQLYCDGKMIASTGTHDVLVNWNPPIDTYCKTMELRMLDNDTDGRNTTSIVGTWVTTSTTLYSYVLEWSNGQDWRFNSQYSRIYGANPQVPTTRKVYSYPLTYTITYNLNGGTANGTLITSYTVLDDVSLPTCSKKGYDFLGFYDSSGNKVESIKKGTYGNISLHARYERRLPTLYIGYTYFDQEDTTISSSDVIKQVNARAIDELEGDITSKIIIKNIFYENKNKNVSYPDYLEIDSEDIIYISFSVTNNEGKTAVVNRKYYILGKGKESEEKIDDIEIYSRYIDEKYINTLDDNSIWNTPTYKSTLLEVFKDKEE